MLSKLKNVQSTLITLSLLWSVSAAAQDAHVAPSIPMACPAVLEARPFTGAVATIGAGLVSAGGLCHYSEGKQYTQYALKYENKNTKPPTMLYQFPISPGDVNKFTTSAQWQRTSVTGYEFSCGNTGGKSASPVKPDACLLVFDGNGSVATPATVSVQAKLMDPISNEINSSLKLMIQCYSSSNQQIACNAFDQNILVWLAQFFSDNQNQVWLDKAVKTIAVAMKGDEPISADKSCAGLSLNPKASGQPSLILKLHTEIDSKRITQVDSIECAMGVVS